MKTTSTRLLGLALVLAARSAAAAAAAHPIIEGLRANPELGRQTGQNLVKLIAPLQIDAARLGTPPEQLVLRNALQNKAVEPGSLPHLFPDLPAAGAAAPTPKNIASVAAIGLLADVHKIEPETVLQAVGEGLDPAQREKLAAGLARLRAAGQSVAALQGQLQERLRLNDEGAAAGLGGRLSRLYEAAKQNTAAAVAAAPQPGPRLEELIPAQARLRRADQASLTPRIDGELLAFLQGKIEKDYSGLSTQVTLSSEEFDPARVAEIERALVQLGVHSFLVNDPTQAQHEALKARGASLINHWVLWSSPVTTPEQFMAAVKSNRKRAMRGSLDDAKKLGLSVEFKRLTVEDYEEIWRIWKEFVAGREGGAASLWAPDFAQKLKDGKFGPETGRGRMEDWVRAFVYEPGTGKLLGGIVGQYRHERGILHMRMGGFRWDYIGRTHMPDGTPVAQPRDYHLNDLALWEVLHHLNEGPEAPYLMSEGMDSPVPGQFLTAATLADKKARNAGRASIEDRMQSFLLIQPSKLATMSWTNRDQATGILIMAVDEQKPLAKEYFAARARGEKPTALDLLGHKDVRRARPAGDYWGEWIYLQPPGTDFAPTAPEGVKLRVVPLAQ